MFPYAAFPAASSLCSHCFYTLAVLTETFEGNKNTISFKKNYDLEAADGFTTDQLIKSDIFR